MATAKRKVSKEGVELRVNLRDLLGRTVGQSEKEEIGEALIEKILERTQAGKSVSGKNFVGYGKEYAKSIDFRAGGKSKSKVNLTLTGDMLGLLDIKESSRDTITLGWDDNTENLKAFNHVTGDTVPKRDFFGITQRELDEIKKEFK